MPLCKTCMTLPEPLSRSGRVLLAVPIVSTENALDAWTLQAGLPKVSLGSGLLAIRLDGADSLARLVEFLTETMSGPELADARVLHQDKADAEIRPLDLLRAGSAAEFVAKVRGEWLPELLNDGRLDTAFQPIFDLKTGRLAAHECLMRGIRDGQPVFPGDLINTARATGLLFHLDRAARVTSLRNAATRGVTGPGVDTDLFVNFNPTSIYNPAACLQTTVKEAEKCGIPRERLVFEVVESDDVEDRGHLLDILRFYRNEGFRVALDDLGSGYGSLNLLTEIRPDVVKLDMALIRNVDKDPVRQSVVRHLLNLARSLEITSVVEGVETIEERDVLRDAGADLVQGYLYAKPAAEPWRAPPYSLAA